MIHTFKATHCGQTFTGADGAKALEAHMKTHRAMSVPKWERDRMGKVWAPSKLSDPRPTPWKAPKAPTDTRKLTKVLAEHEDRGPGHYGQVLEWHTDALVSASELAPGDVFTLPRGTEAYRVIDAHPSPIDGNPLEIQLEIVGKPGPARWLPMAGRRQLESSPVVLVSRAS